MRHLPSKDDLCESKTYCDELEKACFSQLHMGGDMVESGFYFGTANRMTNMTRCKRPKKIISRMNQVNSRSNSHRSPGCALIV